MERFRFTAGIYQFTGDTLLGPADELKLTEGDYLAALHPPKKIDPKGLYIFVVDNNNTYTVSKTTLKEIERVSLTWERPWFATHNQEIALQVKAMKEFMATYKPPH